MAQAASIVFVVRRLAIDFIKPAQMDDVLAIETRLTSLGAASFEFAQAILRDETKLAEALVGVVALKGDRPARLPAELRALLLDRAIS
jgi:acyl-CoA thioester hydrolase